jgi:hypothetical protein
MYIFSCKTRIYLDTQFTALCKTIITCPYVNQLSDVVSMLSAAPIPCTLRIGCIYDRSFSIVAGCRFLVQHCKTYSRDSIVNIATSYGTDGPGCESRWEQEIFLFSETSIPTLGPTLPSPAPTTMGTIKFHYWKYSRTEDRKYFCRGPHDGHPWPVACSHTWLSRPRGFIALNYVQWREYSKSHAVIFITEVSLCLVFNAILIIAVSQTV